MRRHIVRYWSTQRWWWSELEVGGGSNSNVIVVPNRKIILFNSLTFSFYLGLGYLIVLFVVRVHLGSKWVMFGFVWVQSEFDLC